MRKPSTGASGTIVTLADLAPRAELKAGTGRRVFGADALQKSDSAPVAVVRPLSSKPAVKLKR